MAARGPFQKRLGYAFKQPELMELALTHPSLSHEQSEKLINNIESRIKELEIKEKADDTRRELS